MAFRLHQDESISDGLRRLAVKQLRSARDELRRTDGSRDTHVYEARKSVKKVRAILQLIEDDHGQHLSDSKKRLRTVNRRLSKLRDAEAPIEILDKIRHANPRLLSEHTLGRIRRVLARQKHDTEQAARRDRSRDKAAETLRVLRKTAKRWRPRHDEFAALAAGMRAAHRRGRKAMKRAVKSGRAVDFHEFRKRIKTLWYAARLLDGCGPGVRKDVRTLDRAETLLGDDHNAVILCGQLFGDPSAQPLPDLQRLRSAVTTYQMQRRKQALVSARRIYGVSSKNFVRRMKKAWKRWHRAASSASSRGRRAAA